MAWRFEPGEGLQQAFRRVSLEEIAKVRASLGGTDGDRGEAIHEARQAFKRLRALCRLARPALGANFAAENRRWRDAGQLLSDSRDMTVVLESFDSLAAECSTNRKMARLRARLAGSGARNGSDDFKEKLRQLFALLDNAETSAAELAWPSSEPVLLRGFKRTQKRLRRDWKAARKEPASERFHCWRKRTKDQSAQLRLFRRILPPACHHRIDVEKETAELLGQDHDLWVLSERLRSALIPGDLADARDLLLAKIEKQRAELQREAFHKGKSFSSQKAKALAQSVGKAWEKALARVEKKRQRRAKGANETLGAAISPPR